MLKHNHIFPIKLIKWYQSNKRELPWRNTTDPYVIWLSEIILQQTRVVQGLPYFTKFLDKYPTVFDLARAEENDILRMWQGLGYYSRARNLHSCARSIIEKYDGNFPESYKELLKLKGIGNYTAAAIASFAYKEKVPVLDGNVYRVLSRIFGIKNDISDQSSQKVFYKKASDLIDVKRPDIFNQAIMEFGAVHCSPKTPKCSHCIFADICYARLHGQQEHLPVKTKKVKVKKRHFHYLIVEHEGMLLMKQRTDKDIWQGLFDFLLIEKNSTKIFDDLIKESTISDLIAHDGVLEKESRTIKHILTHQRILTKFFHIHLEDKKIIEKLKKTYNSELFCIDQIQELPKPILIDNYLNETIF